MDFYPSDSIFAVPAVNMCINREYIPFISGVLETLTLPELWPDPDVTGMDFPYEIQRLLRRMDTIFAGYECNPDTGDPFETFEHTFDFSIDEQGFVPIVATGGDRAVYIPGLGWGSIYNIGGLGNLELRIHRSAAATRDWNSVEVFFESNVNLDQFDVFDFHCSGPTPISGLQDTLVDCHGTFSTQQRIDMSRASASGSIVIYKMIVRGNGVDPF